MTIPNIPFPGSRIYPIKEGFSDDLLELLIIAKKSLKGINMTFQEHPAAVAGGEKIEKLIGYIPTGQNQIIFEKEGRKISCIRGPVSFGAYEIMIIEGDWSKKWPRKKEDLKILENTERYSYPKEVILRIRELLL